MLVYGDVERVETVGDRQNAIGLCLDRMAGLPPGSERHAALVRAFIGTSELVQGLVDADFQARGWDTLSPVHASGMECLSLLAHGIVRSWRSGFSDGFRQERFREELLRFNPEQTIRTKQAEGYAFYALYPETYVEAALRSGLGPDTHVIGIRSIGVGLGALVAAALHAAPALTVRPGGHPFRREIAVDPAITAQLTENPDATFAVVDEGPGLSGSSFGAVADWLEGAGIAHERIHFFPSHAGQLGPEASPKHRERWSRASRHFVSMDSFLLTDEHRHLAHWIEDLTGSRAGELEDISGGAWRQRRNHDQTQWPPANIQQERRKFLSRTDDITWLVKFVGLGDSGLHKYSMGQQLHEAGFTPEIRGYCHGFLVERWHEDAVSLDRKPFALDELLNRVGAYLGFRARFFLARPHQGASLAELREMAQHNTRQALGDQAALLLDRRMPDIEHLDQSVRRIFTDNRMQAWEWLVVDGRLIKTDAIDHCAAHDLVGCQDVTWDIAGASVELSLSDPDKERLCAIVEEESGHPVSRDLLALMLPCYLAFQLGAHTMAAGALAGSEEEPRLRRAAGLYGALLQEHLERPGFGKEQDKVPAG